jgi:hypothetical protein
MKRELSGSPDCQNYGYTPDPCSPRCTVARCAASDPYPFREPDANGWDDRTMFGTDGYSTLDTVRGADYKKEDER